MKVLLFTHKQDIDGIGCILLAQEAFSQLTYVPCKTFEITKKVKESIDDGTIYQYDFIFVTDLCVKEPVLKEIAEDPLLDQKFLIFDHHKTEIEEGNDRYDFVHIIVSNEHGKTCGTSLFYAYLVESGYIKKRKVLDELVELTRLHDTWEWKQKQIEKARDLFILFEQIGYSKYIEVMSKLIQNKSEILFDKAEENMILEFKKNFERDSKKKLENIHVVELQIMQKNYRIGYVYAPYKYRNDLNELLISDNPLDIDALGMIMTDTDTVSYRNIKAVDVSSIAVYFDGKGHKNASTHSQNNVKFKRIIEQF